MNDPSEVREVRSLLDEPGCVPCLAAARGARRYLHQVLWEGVTDVDVRRRIRDSGGFCREHFAVAVDLGKDEGLAPGLAIILEDLLGRLAAEIAEQAASAAGSSKPRARKRGRVAGSGDSTDAPRCPACAAAVASADRALWLLARVEPETQIAVEVAGPGRTLCVPHLCRGSAQATADAERAQLRSLFSVGIERTSEQLAGFIRKTEHRHRDEAMSAEEAASWELAADIITGAPPGRRRPRSR